MTGFELKTSGIISNCSANLATTNTNVAFSSCAAPGPRAFSEINILLRCLQH